MGVIKAHDVMTGEELELYEDMLVFSDVHDFRYLLSVPHGGRLIPVSMADDIRLGRDLLISTDLHTGRLYDIKAGARVVTRLNCYAVNMSRAREGDPHAYAEHLKRGPFEGCLLNGERARKREPTQEEEQYLLSFYHRYHSLVARTLEQMKQEHGFALLFDCHSLNSVGLKGVPDEGRERADFCLGTVDDTSADPRIIDACYDTLRKEAAREGYTVAKNVPYKGGYITQHYGRPKEGVHAMQLEVKRLRYMHEGLDGESPQDFTIRAKELPRISSIIKKAFDAAFEEARRLHHQA